MQKSQMIFSKYSPLMAVDTPLIGSDGETMTTPRVCSLCRCGASSAKPYCDGTHSRIGFVGERDDSAKTELEYYRGRDLTIVYDRYLCMGAGHCGELEAVFGTHDAPRYEPDAAPVDAIVATIKKCPSGALSYLIQDEPRTHYYGTPRLVVEQDGPLHCRGAITLIDDQDSDQLLPKGDHFTLCRCGGSKKKPLCDGSHVRLGFKG
jgi:CDGSH-type Zn-finger protein/ferredoxin